jgi:hypothetical protein
MEVEPVLARVRNPHPLAPLSREGVSACGRGDGGEGYWQAGQTSGCIFAECFSQMMPS